MKWSKGVSSTSCSWTDENDLQGSVTMDLAFLLTFLEVRLQTQCICGWLNPITTFQISRELVKNLLTKLTSFSQPSDLLPLFLFLFKDSFFCSKTVLSLSLLSSYLLVWLAVYCHLSVHHGGAFSVEFLPTEQCRIPQSFLMKANIVVNLATLVQP